MSGAGNLASCGVVDCRPPVEPEVHPVPRRDQAIDYMARDYESFMRAMLDLLPSRVPGWREHGEADLGMAIMELFAYQHDKLSYRLDRTSLEGTLPTATQYESVRKLLSLIDYALDPGIAARGHLAFQVSPAAVLVPAGTVVSSSPAQEGTLTDFSTDVERLLYPELNQISLAAAAPANPDRTLVVLSALLAGMLGKGDWIWLEGEGEADGEWARLAEPAIEDAVSGTTNVLLDAPLKGTYQPPGQVRGNGIPATHGTKREETMLGSGRPGQELPLAYAPLTFLADAAGNPVTSLTLTVDGTRWTQVEDFIETSASDTHFQVVTANDGFSTIRFGAGGRSIPALGSSIQARYRTGIGRAGLVAAGTLTRCPDFPSPIAVSNPLPSRASREPESIDQGKLQGPRHIKRQLRAVTPGDYETALLGGVPLGGQTIALLHVKATMRWTGSWQTAFVSVDVPDRRPLRETPELREAMRARLEQRHLAGYDVELTDARYAPLYVGLTVHVKPEFLARRVREGVARALSSRVFADGTTGFFAPPRLGFGQDLFLSDLYSAAMVVEGIEYLAVDRFKRLGDRYPDRESQGVIEIGPLEIPRCDSDPAHLENGVITIRTCGGRDG